MILVYLIVILMVAGILAWFTGRMAARVISLAAVIIDLLLTIGLIWTKNDTGGNWIMEFKTTWIPLFGIEMHLALDGISLLMLLLTFFIGVLAVLVSWNEITKNTGFYHFNLMFILSGITGVFLSMDLFLFYFFWEVMLIPMYFLIAMWGHENRVYASYKFFIFTQASGLLMFLGIVGIYLLHGNQTGVYTFNYQNLIGTKMRPAFEMLMMCGFLAAFMVKLPAFPFHSWLPDAHTEAPTAGSLILAALMLKTGAYGLIRFIVPLFPNAAERFAPVGMILGIAGILYGAKLAFAQTDLKRMVAYSSVNHMGFIMLGVFALNQLAWQGVVMQMIAHGISTGALFIIAGQLSERLHTRELSKMGGLWEEMPVMGGMGLIFVMASLGLPGLGNFIAEFLTLTGAFKANILLACLASVGLIAATLYSIRIMQKVFYGEKHASAHVRDLSLRELVILGSLVVIIFFLGLFPKPAIELSKQPVDRTLRIEQTQHANIK